MRISPGRLGAEAEATGFRSDVLEKALHLLRLLEAIQSHPFLRGKLALKGGTALNLFVFDVPRLSVDIDLNYVGAEGRDAMMDERPGIEEAMQAVFSREDYGVRRTPSGEHAGGKWSLRYASALGNRGRIDVDVNYMYRVPLWPLSAMDSRPIGGWQAEDIPVLNLHELAAGKLVALLDRHQARDLFDGELVLSMPGLDALRLRTAFVVYGGMARRDWRTVSAKDVAFERAELTARLLPALQGGRLQNIDAADYGDELVERCRRGLSTLLPLNVAERNFLDLLLEKGRIDATLLTSDAALQRRIQAQPMLEWKAQNVRGHRGLP